MKKILSMIFLALLCGACGNTSVQQVNTIDQNVTIELSVRMEVNGNIEDSHNTQFIITKGSAIPASLTLKSDSNVTVTFTDFRLEDEKVLFGAWGFDGFANLSSKSGTKGTAWPYNAQQSGGFSIPVDGSKELDKLLTWYETEINDELMKAYVTMNMRTN